MKLREEDVILKPSNPTTENPEGEFEIDYSQHKSIPQKKGMRVKGAIKESIGRHQAQKVEGGENVNRLLAERKKRAAEARRKRREKRKKDREADNKSED